MSRKAIASSSSYTRCASRLPAAISQKRHMPGPYPGKNLCMVRVQPGTIVVYADIGCPCAHVCVYRLHRARALAGLDDAIRFDLRAYPLELFNEKPSPKKVLDAEIPVS